MASFSLQTAFSRGANSPMRIDLGGGAEHLRQGHPEGLIFDAVLAQDG
jgi:hypothetical protein